MNRFNFGNSTTNAFQTLGISATAAKGVFKNDDAASRLNNDTGGNNSGDNNTDGSNVKGNNSVNNDDETIHVTIGEDEVGRKRNSSSLDSPASNRTVYRPFVYNPSSNAFEELGGYIQPTAIQSPQTENIRRKVNNDFLYLQDFLKKGE